MPFRELKSKHGIRRLECLGLGRHRLLNNRPYHAVTRGALVASCEAIRIFVRLFLLQALLSALFLSSPSHAENERKLYLLDYNTGTVLRAENFEVQFHPASVTKLMTLAVVFKALQEGELDLQTRFAVSEYAWRNGGAPKGRTTMFAELGSLVSVDDLLRGLVIHTANDAALVLAEGIAGSEEKFVEKMNDLAASIGMTKSRFADATGYEDKENKTTVRDVGRLMTYIIRSFPEYNPMFLEPSFTWNKIRQLNKGFLIGGAQGVDMMMAGFEENSGYSIVATAVANGKRIVLAVSGIKDADDRKKEAIKYLEWAFNNIETVILFEEGETVGYASVFGGTKGRLSLVGDGPVTLSVPQGQKRGFSAKIFYRGPIEAPVTEGDPVGELRVWNGPVLSQQIPLYAGENIAVGNLRQRAQDGLFELLFSWVRLL